MRILITGGSGFIGRALCQSWLAEGREVVVLTRQIERAAAVLPAATRLVAALDEVGEVDAVVNLAGANLSTRRWTEAYKRVLRESRLGTTRALYDWIEGLARRPSILVSASAVGWYGPRGDAILDENAEPGVDFAARLCRDWEAEAMRIESLGVRVCRIRIGIVLDPSGGALAQMQLPFRLGLGGRIGDGRQWMSWISRADLVALIGWLIDSERARGVYNATAPQPVTNAEFARALGRALHRPAVLPLPGFVLRLRFGEMADLLLSGQRVIPARARAEGFTFRHPDLTTALAVLG
jgi:hypothetical protein